MNRNNINNNFDNINNLFLTIQVKKNNLKRAVVHSNELDAFVRVYFVDRAELTLLPTLIVDA